LTGRPLQKKKRYILHKSDEGPEMATLRWVDWFNHHRLFGPIGYITPAEAEANYYAAINNLDMAA
jgi:transposase InsO family protein